MAFKKIFIVVALVSLILFPRIAAAHLGGQPPFFKVNGKYANYYSVPLTSLNDFDLPQDSPPDNYLINNPISFEMDTTQLPVPPEIVKQSKFYWDFGDGISGTGLQNTHSYKNIGSYILKINVDDGTVPKPQLLESILINVLPDSNYQLPQAVILVNGTGSQDPLTDILSADFSKVFQIDGTSSKSKNTIISYFWDFGDQTSSTGPKLSHNYKTDFSQIIIVLRVRNSDGFLADNFIEVKNQIYSGNILPTQGKNNPVNQSNFPTTSQIIYLGGGILALIIATFIIKSSKYKSKKR